MDRKSSCYYSEVKLLQNGCSVLFLFSVQEPDKATCTCWSLIKQQCCLTTDRTTMTCFVWGWGGSRHFFYGCLFFSEISTATFPTCRCPWLQRLGGSVGCIAHNLPICRSRRHRAVVSTQLVCCTATVYTHNHAHLPANDQGFARGRGAHVYKKL